MALSDTSKAIAIAVLGMGVGFCEALWVEYSLLSMFGDSVPTIPDQKTSSDEATHGINGYYLMEEGWVLPSLLTIFALILAGTAVHWIWSKRFSWPYIVTVFVIFGGYAIGAISAGFLSPWIFDLEKISRSLLP